MATRSERFHASEERAHAKEKRATAKSEKRTKPGVPPAKRSRARTHTEKKATYALEQSVGRPSRKSTRKSANRAKPASSFDIREELQRGGPEASFRKARARTSHPRGAAKPS